MSDHCKPSRSRVLQLLAASILVAATAGRVLAAGTCEVSSFGLSTSSEDNSAALDKVLKSCAGRRIELPPGTYALRPAGYQLGFVLSGGTTLEGSPSGATVLKVADSGNYASLLWIRESHVAVRRLRLEGSHYDSGCAHRLDYGHAINVYTDAKATSSIEDVTIEDNTFVDFNGMSWVSFNAPEGSPGIGRDSLNRIVKNHFISTPALRGGCAHLGMGYSVVMVSLHGSDESGHGLVENVSISSNTFEAAYVKQAVALWSGTHRIDVQHNDIKDAGAGLPGTSGELGRYAINIYDSAHERPGLHPSDIEVVDNTIEHPFSCGVYVAAGRRIEIRQNRISGQSDQYDVTLPKGAIALNHAEESVVRDNELSNNHIGITAVAGTVQLNSNRINAAPGGIRTKIWHSDHAPPQIDR